MPLFAVLAAALSAASPQVVTPPAVVRPGFFQPADKCPSATAHLARKGSVYRGDPARPQKLNELPDADTFAAVYRVENGCMVPVLYPDTREIRPPKP